MKIGLSFFPVRPNYLLPIVQRADQLNYDSVWISEHLVFPVQIESIYPYDSTLGPPSPTTPLFDPLITLSYLAAQTQTIRLGTAIYVAALRHPISTAKLCATLDVLSGGRLILGLGAGWLREEFAAVDIAWRDRGARLDECITVMRKLWSEQLAAHQGRFYHFPEVGFEPKPTQFEIPIMIGGESPSALARAARLGNGWLGLRHSPASAARMKQELRAMRSTSDTSFEITIEAEAVPSSDDLRRYRDAGVDRLILNSRLLSGGEKTIVAALEGLERLAEINHSVCRSSGDNHG